LLGVILNTEPNRWRFQRGVSSHPALDSANHAANRDELCAIYARPEAPTVRLGTLKHASDLPAFAITDNLLGKHFAVLGTTGAGKSCAVTVILRAILDAYPYGHIIMLDPHNEYKCGFGTRAELLDPSNLKLPYWLLNFEEIAAVLVNRSRPPRLRRGAILRDAIPRRAARTSGRIRGTSTSRSTRRCPIGCRTWSASSTRPWVPSTNPKARPPISILSTGSRGSAPTSATNSCSRA
jgi:hypothetical protein